MMLDILVAKILTYKYDNSVGYSKATIVPTGYLTL